MLESNNSVHKANLCNGNTCVTVYGNAAKAIEVVIVMTVVILSASLIAKVLN